MCTKPARLGALLRQSVVRSCQRCAKGRRLRNARPGCCHRLGISPASGNSSRPAKWRLHQSVSEILGLHLGWLLRGTIPATWTSLVTYYGFSCPRLRCSMRRRIRTLAALPSRDWMPKQQPCTPEYEFGSAHEHECCPSATMGHVTFECDEARFPCCRRCSPPTTPGWPQVVAATTSRRLQAFVLRPPK